MDWDLWIASLCIGALSIPLGKSFEAVWKRIDEV
jgi:hypothetical protein